MVGEYASRYPGAVNPLGAAADPEMSGQALLKVAQTSLSPSKITGRDRKSAEKPVDKDARQPYSVIKEALPKLSQEQRQIVEFLTQERHIDEIIAGLGLPASKVSAELTLLEIKGIIKREPGKRISLK